MKHVEMSAATRAALVKQFCKAYSTDPIEKITVKEISGGAGVSRVTFYNYFKDPYDLLDSLEDEIVDRIVSAVRNGICDMSDPEAFFQRFASTAENNANMMRVLLSGSRSSAFVEKIERAIVPLIKESLGADVGDPQVGYAIDYHVAGMVAILRRWLAVGDISVDALAACVRQLFTRGALSIMKE